jgi:hypothetical protein
MKKKFNAPKLSEEELEKYRSKVRALCNSERFDKARDLAEVWGKKYPESIIFSYHEAVFSAEDDRGLTPAQIKTRHKRAAVKIRALFPRIKTASAIYRGAIRNEYYWFSHQPYKQYLLGKELVKKGQKRYYYSQGVGAEQLAKRYALEGRYALAIRWAKISEKAWINFFKVDDQWLNSYFFYAAVLGYQGRFDEMNVALEKAATIAKKSKNWSGISERREEIERVLSKLQRKIGK